MKSLPFRRVKHLVNEQFFYLQFRIRPKSAVLLPVCNAQEVALEVPRKLIEDWKEENPDQKVSDESIAAEIARVVVLDIAFPGIHRPECEFVGPNWLERRPPVMNARPCDHHDNGIRAWSIKSGDALPAE